VWGLHMTETAKMPAHPPLCVLSGAIAGLACQGPLRIPWRCGFGGGASAW